MNKDLTAIFDYLEREKGIKRSLVIAAIEESLTIAARKSVEGEAKVRVQIDPKTGNIDVFCEKRIVEEVYEPAQELSLEDAQVLDPDCELGQYIDIVVTPKHFGRIAAQKARQVITQKLRNAERDVIYEEYRHRINEIVSGTVKRFVRGSNIIVDLGKVEALMPSRHYPKTERYQVGDRVMAVLLEVQDTDNGGAEVILSRSAPEFARQLFIQEVPEIEDGTVSIEYIVRDAGYRTKVAVRSSDPQVDPVGACVGMRGIRVKNIVRELDNEKVDIIPHSTDKMELLQNAMAPIVLRRIQMSDDESLICVVVDDEDFGTVIGKKGKNIRLTGSLLDADMEAKRMTDFQKTLELDRRRLVELQDSRMDESLHLPKISSLVLPGLASEGYDTPRALLGASVEDLVKIDGITQDLAEEVLEMITEDVLHWEKTSS